MSRIDISEYLIHFTKSNSEEEAFENLLQIISEKCLRGSSNMIKGGYSCVCFSEAPLEILSDGLINPDYYSKYSAFGIMVKKIWLFEKGGRPVIYQTDDEFNELPETHRWRHVRYDPLSDPPVDFTWEREWRINIQELLFDSDVASIVIPEEQWKGSIIKEHENRQNHIMEEHIAMGCEEYEAWMLREPFRWKIFELR